ncbi:MAG: uracil-DNA glycosylase [Calditrichia bacterium]
MNKPNDLPFQKLHDTVSKCRKCPRLVEWREKVAREKTRRFMDWDYWGRPLPGFGDPAAGLWVIGLAPAVHGGNRTGRVFTGDRSGDWLFRALHRAGFASQPESRNINDGLKLTDCYISAVVRCAPPANKPLHSEYDNCLPYLLREKELLKNLKIILCLGQISFSQTLVMLEKAGFGPFRPKPHFQHGREITLQDGTMLLSCYHPSQRNTFTGLLTENMFDAVFRRVNSLLCRRR